MGASFFFQNREDVLWWLRNSVWILFITSVVGSVHARVVGGCVGAWGGSSFGDLSLCNSADASSCWCWVSIVDVGVDASCWGSVVWESLAVFPLLLSALGLLPQSWGLLMPVCWLLLLFQLGCDRIHRLRNLVLAIWSSLNSSGRCSMPVGGKPPFFLLPPCFI